MADSPTFEWLCERLQERTHLGRLPARGTVRLALKRGGLDPETVNPAEMTLVLERILPAGLAQRAVGDGETLCQELRKELGQTGLSAAEADHQTPEEVFRRVFGG